MHSFLIAMAAAAPPAAPIPLPPKKAWVVDYAETFCTAGRPYGDAGAPLDLVLRPSPKGDLVQFYILRNGTYMSAAHVSVAVGFADTAVKTTALVYGGKKSGRRTILINIGRESLAEFPKARAVTFRGAGIDYAFAVPDLDKVVAALATCNADLRSHWNITEEGKAKIETPAKPITDLRSILSSGDYPAQAIREEDTGTAHVMLLIDENGKVADCLLQATSGNASLDAMTCIAFIERARFHPALDAAGKPMKSAVFTAASWRIQQ
jgi:TonB family protein